MSQQDDMCLLCGGRPNARVRARWVLHIPIAVASQNGRDGRSGGANKGGNRWAYKHAREQYTAALRVAMRREIGPGGQLPRTPKRVVITRYWAKRQRAFDHANLVGGAKPLVDAMVRVGLLVDDSPEWFEGYYRQARDPDGRGWTVIVIEEVEEVEPDAT